MSGTAELTAACRPAPADELAHLAAALPGGDLLASYVDTSPQPATCAVQDWAAWGLARLTGPADGPATAPAAPVAARVRALTAGITALLDPVPVGSQSGRPGNPAATDPAQLLGPQPGRPQPSPHRPGNPAATMIDPAALLTGRASLHGWVRAGRTSVNGTCRLVRAADGWLAVNLSRPSDLELLPALLQTEFTGDPWDALASAASRRPAADLAARAQLLGTPAVVLGSDADLAPLRWWLVGAPAPAGTDVVLDLSAMWAGPLCAHLLGRAGAQVVKVEDVHRPDGARFGPPEFYAELHAGHASVVLDFATADGRAALHALAAEADVVIESSRPRALRALGLIADEWLAAGPGRTWISITGYGRDDPADRVAFGDDAAVAGGLVAEAADGTPLFCADAIADPLTGLYAALAGLTSRAAGGGHLLDVAMAGVAADIGRPGEGTVRGHAIDATGVHPC